MLKRPELHIEIEEERKKAEKEERMWNLFSKLSIDTFIYPI